ncbi:MAG: hypothetical protein IJL12_04595 [Selenomonadaceae bacterium]|nr:hypothetical protein [Selenomonadaceae bacterium]MBQ4402913.1 hypothetical protein [Selenomonadaceae bacterium]MBQ6131600.1 hypothetical protein [Selenomonadaceae bacterium]
MFKKILIVFAIIGVIAVIGFVALGYGTYKIADGVLTKYEPQMRQYIQMDEAAQNKYVLENIGKFLADVKIDIDRDGKPEDKESIKRLLELNTQPEIEKALINVGRSLMAMGITASDSIVKDMSADVKAKYEKETEEFEARLNKYSELIEAADPSFKIEK